MPYNPHEAVREPDAGSNGDPGQSLYNRKEPNEIECGLILDIRTSALIMGDGFVRAQIYVKPSNRSRVFLQRSSSQRIAQILACPVVFLYANASTLV